MNIGTLTGVLRARAALRSHDRWTATELVDWQVRALRDLRAFATARSPYYREIHRGLDDAPLSALPIVTKQQLMERFDDVVTDRAVRLADVEAYLDQAAATAERIHALPDICAREGQHRTGTQRMSQHREPDPLDALRAANPVADDQLPPANLARIRARVYEETMTTTSTRDRVPSRLRLAGVGLAAGATLALVLALASALLPDARRRGLKGIAVLGAFQIGLILVLAPALPALSIVLGTGVLCAALAALSLQRGRYA